MKNLVALSLSGLLVLTLAVNSSYGQRKKNRDKIYPAYSSSKPKREDQFLQTQWWLGFRAGLNLTEVEPTKRYSGFSPINYEPKLNEKSYSGFELPGGHAGLEITFYHKGFSFSVQPNYRRQRFSYSNTFEWRDSENQDNRLELKYEQDHQLDYIEIPLFIKYDILKGTARPFVQVGAYYATLVSANKAVEITGTDYASGNAGPFKTEKAIIGAKDLFIKSSVGIAGGLGVSYDFWNVRLVFDATYRYGLNNISNAKNRYSENQLTGIGDALDDLEMRNISFNLGFLFPLRFISKNYNATN
ncbi:hypothetical protein C900_01375 [Fulvivirga imtechensis AK7]|uniref:Outer membrane protein beta-barrel domain-containing protein n=1 Tax=Fulvivirga imtechensis AK7 TaxID=1237149 RepID=L8JYC8_9BACT|nr:porin family protein [Fulvivirga imtechensis]ELR73765.1 hypothetical protein C900_01375 [Fulvivirga imtechensis AK7]